MKTSFFFTICISILLSCKKESNNQNDTIKRDTVSEQAVSEQAVSDANNDMATDNRIQFYQLFPEDADIKFTPKDLENTKDPEQLEFKKKLAKYEEGDPTIEGIGIDNLSVLINHETFTESKRYVNSSWLEYLLNKYDLHYTFNDLMKMAIEQEDYNGIKILIKKGYIFRKEETEMAKTAKEVGQFCIKMNKENNGFDTDGSPLFYDSSYSKFDEILI